MPILKNKRTIILISPVVLGALFFAFQNFSSLAPSPFAAKQTFLFVDLGDGAQYPIPIGGSGQQGAFSRDWTSVENQIYSAPTAAESAYFATQAGLTLTMLSGTDVNSLEMTVEFDDPVTGSSVATITQKADLIPGSFPYIAPSSAETYSQYVCQYNGFNFLINNLTPGKPPVVASILHAGVTTVNMTYIETPGGFGSGATIRAAVDMTSRTGLTVTSSYISSDTDLTTAINQIGNNSAPNTAQIAVYCANNLDARNGGQTELVQTAHAGTIAKIPIACNKFALDQALQCGLEHEMMHAYGGNHDTGNDEMNYAVTYGSGECVVPAGAVDFIKAAISTTPTPISMKANNCMTAQDYHAVNCAVNSAYEFDCAGGPYSGVNGSPASISWFPLPDLGPTCYSSIACNPPLIYDPLTCNCYEIGQTTVRLFDTSGNPIPIGNLPAPISTGSPVEPDPVPAPTQTIEPEPVPTYTPPPSGGDGGTTPPGGGGLCDPEEGEYGGCSDC